MWLLMSLHVRPNFLISGLESDDLCPLVCLTAPVPPPDVSPRCHVSSTGLLYSDCGCLGVWPHRAPDCSRGKVLEVGEATCHCPTAMEASGETWSLGFIMSAETKSRSTTHGAAQDQSNKRNAEKGRERERQGKRRGKITSLLQRVTMLAPSKWKTAPVETAKSLRTNFPSAKPGASNYMKWLDNQSVSNTPKAP